MEVLLVTLVFVIRKAFFTLRLRLHVHRFYNVLNWVQCIPMELLTRNIKKIKGAAHEDGGLDYTCKRAFNVCILHGLVLQYYFVVLIYMGISFLVMVFKNRFYGYK